MFCCTDIMFEILLKYLFFFVLFFIPTDHRHVPDTESGNVHREILASGNWIFAHIRRTHVENLEVNLFAHFLLIVAATRSFGNNSPREASLFSAELVNSHWIPPSCTRIRPTVSAASASRSLVPPFHPLTTRWNVAPPRVVRILRSNGTRRRASFKVYDNDEDETNTYDNIIIIIRMTVNNNK